VQLDAALHFLRTLGGGKKNRKEECKEVMAVSMTRAGRGGGLTRD